MTGVRPGRLTYSGHSIVRSDAGDWRCSCGVPLSGGTHGTGRVGARDVMRFHIADLETTRTADGFVRYGKFLVNTRTGEIIGPRGHLLDGSTSEDGYRFIQDGKARRKLYWHRIVWCAANGPVPEGMEINHLNGIKADNRLANLEAVTRSENVLHAFRIGLKSNRGIKHPGHKLSEAQVIEIRRRHASGAVKRDLASEFGVGRKTVSDIVIRNTWTHLLDEVT